MNDSVDCRSIRRLLCRISWWLQPKKSSLQARTNDVASLWIKYSMKSLTQHAIKNLSLANCHQDNGAASISAKQSCRNSRTNLMKILSLSKDSSKTIKSAQNKRKSANMQQFWISKWRPNDSVKLVNNLKRHHRSSYMHPNSRVTSSQRTSRHLCIWLKHNKCRWPCHPISKWPSPYRCQHHPSNQCMRHNTTNLCLTSPSSQTITLRNKLISHSQPFLRMPMINSSSHKRYPKLTLNLTSLDSKKNTAKTCNDRSK